MALKNLIRIDVYLTKEEFAEVANHAIEAKFRHGGVKLYNPTRKGPVGSMVPNRKGIAEYLKHCESVYIASKAEDILKIAASLKKKQEAETELAGLGVKM